MFCKRPLGSNEVVETFPVGRRLAFDAARGRLWVVCLKCRRWNLTPLEERWEAVEDCERLFRGTKLRTSTEQIGIARHPEGLDLVRIGRPLRPEFAAWRYGDQFRRRLRLAAVGGVVAGAAGMALVSLPVSSGLLLVGWWGWFGWQQLRTIARVRVGSDDVVSDSLEAAQVVGFRRLELRSIRLVPDEGELGFAVEVVNKGWQKARFAGSAAQRVAAATVPLLNSDGGSMRTVRKAVGEIESDGHPSRLLRRVARNTEPGRYGTVTNRIVDFRKATRLALEMALHEEQERRALEGELWILEQAWKEAEEIAAIADNLLVPAGTEAFFERYGEREETEA
ncbi:MAG: hypothetical protein OXI71_14340 [Gemmatimonadota bacterium]|nr:hypothetical protein [Gemmatimonadota bacterium]